MGTTGKMPRKPRLTVCVATYNGEKYLKRCIDSLLKQTYKEFDLYVLDNHSTDRTPQIVKSYKDPRVHHVRHPRNIGSLGNFNSAIRTGNGELLSILHDDDEYEPTLLAEQVKVFQAHPEVTCVYARCSIIDEESKRMGQDDIPDELTDRVLTIKEALTYVLRTMRSPYITPSNMNRRSAYRTAGTYSANRFPMAGDVDMHLRLTAAGGAYIIGRRLVRYRHTRNQWSIRYSLSYTVPNQMFGILDGQLRKHRKIVPSAAVDAYEAHREWDYTIVGINILARKTSTPLQRKKARAWLRRSLTWRRTRRLPRQAVEYAITVATLLAAHIGLGGALSRRINATRLARHLAREAEGKA